MLPYVLLISQNTCLLLLHKSYSHSILYTSKNSCNCSHLMFTSSLLFGPLCTESEVLRSPWALYMLTQIPAHFHIYFNNSDFTCTTHNLPLVAESWPATAACWLRCPCTLPGRGRLSHGSPNTNRLVSVHWTPLPAQGPWGNHWQKKRGHGKVLLQQ